MWGWGAFLRGMAGLGIEQKVISFDTPPFLAAEPLIYNKCFHHVLPL